MSMKFVFLIRILVFLSSVFYHQLFKKIIKRLDCLTIWQWKVAYTLIGNHTQKGTA